MFPSIFKILTCISGTKAVEFSLYPSTFFLTQFQCYVQQTLDLNTSQSWCVTLVDLHKIFLLLFHVWLLLSCLVYFVRASTGCSNKQPPTSVSHRNKRLPFAFWGRRRTCDHTGPVYGHLWGFVSWTLPHILDSRHVILIEGAEDQGLVDTPSPHSSTNASPWMIM